MEDKKSPPSTPAWGTPAKPGSSTAKPAAAKPAAAKPATAKPAAAKPAAAKPAAPPPAAAPGENKYTQWYEVKSGDTLWKIAKEHYGDGSLYTEIFKANQDVLTDPDKIQVGQKLRIP